MILELIVERVLFFAAQVSSIPIVDDNDSLLDIYSRRLEKLIVFRLITPHLKLYLQVLSSCSDITSLARDKIYTHINLEETTIHQVKYIYPYEGK